MGIDPLHTGGPRGPRGFFARVRLDTRPLRRRDFRNLWLGQAVSTIGGEIGTVAVPYQVYKLTGSTALVGLLGLASLVPLLVVPLVGGAFADALDRRTVVLVTETGLAVVAVLFLVNALLPHPHVWALFVLQGLAIAVYSFGRPALSSLAPRLVPDEELAAASSLFSVYNSLANVAGPAVGGLLIAASGVTSLVPALVLLAVAGGADFYSAVLRGTMLLRSTPDHLRGRLLGIEFMQVASAPNLGDLESGLLASVTSIRFSVVSGGFGCIGGCIVTALALPRFLKYDAELRS